MRHCGFFYIISIVLLSSCVGHSKYDTALKTIDSLQLANKELLKINDDLLNGEDRLVNLFYLNVSKGNYILAEENYKNLIKYHPESEAIKVISVKAKEIAPKIQAQRDSIEKAIKDSTRLANIDDYGNWKIGEYGNDFGEPTGKYYVYQDVQGYFSNSATSHSDLLVHITIQEGVSMFIYCDEYMDGTNDGSGYGRSGFGNALYIVSTEARKVYRGREGMLEEDSEDGVFYKLIDIFRHEHYYEIQAFGEGKTRYYYSVDTRGLENALLKAKLISLSELK